MLTVKSCIMLKNTSLNILLQLNKLITWQHVGKMTANKENIQERKSLSNYWFNLVTLQIVQQFKNNRPHLPTEEIRALNLFSQFYKDSDILQSILNLFIV